MHIISKCSKLAQYKKPYDNVATMVHWELCSKYDCEPANLWYEHRRERVMENQDTKILWTVL